MGSAAASQPSHRLQSGFRFFVSLGGTERCHCTLVLLHAWLQPGNRPALGSANHNCLTSRGGFNTMMHIGAPYGRTVEAFS